MLILHCLIYSHTSSFSQKQQLQTKGGVPVGGKVGAPMRSKSAYQPNRANDDDNSSLRARQARPASMHQSKLNAAGAAALKKGNAPSQQAVHDKRKQQKVAFGGAVDKKVAPAAAGRSPAAASKAPPKIPPLGGNRAGGRNSDMGGGGGVNGFAKLQQQAGKKQGPMVVTYEDDEDLGVGRRGGGGTRSDSGLELRGQSKYIPVDDGDQLDFLLTNARKGKFS